MRQMLLPYFCSKYKKSNENDYYEEHIVFSLFRLAYSGSQTCVSSDLNSTKIFLLSDDFGWYYPRTGLAGTAHPSLFFSLLKQKVSYS